MRPLIMVPMDLPQETCQGKLKFIFFCFFHAVGTTGIQRSGWRSHGDACVVILVSL
uniref:Uncharacterized protein n=1 Tax=Arundo donax TaxID=35708 RepID=A0A0A9GCS3_ARUDO